MVKPCENEECGKPFIAKRRDTRFCSASCRARAHTLKSRREYLLARTSAAAGVEVVVPPATPATARLERRVRGLEAAIEGARVEAVRGLGELAAELRVGRDQAADAVAELSARVDTEVAAQARRARAAATEGRRRDARLREVEAQLLRVTTLLGALEQRLVALEQAVVVATARLGARQR
ncbi:MAG: hypothetical protein IPN01_36215 [Deltaproteobacteria bacterium]|nr:hypothetical protein [Deltaproteobacteria bacterium]